MRIGVATLFVGLFVAGFGVLVLDRLSTDSPAQEKSVASTDVTYPGDTPGCDGIPDVPECPPYELIEEPTFEGAIERFRNGELRDADVIYLMLTEEDYLQAIFPYLGPAELQVGRNVPADGPWGATMTGIDQSMSFSWFQQWVLTGDSVLFEMVFVLPSPEDVPVFLANHRAQLEGVGVRPFTYKGLGDGIREPVLYRFQDGGAATPARRCVNRVMRAVDRVVFAMTLATGGDCTTPPAELPVGLLAGVVERAEAVLTLTTPLP